MVCVTQFFAQIETNIMKKEKDTSSSKPYLGQKNDTEKLILR